MAFGQLSAWYDGIVNTIVNPIVNAFTTYIVNPIVTFITYIFGAVLYGLQLGMFYVIDAVQMVVRKVVGLPAYTIDGERTFNYAITSPDGSTTYYYDDLAQYFFTHPTTQAVFISVLVAAVFLLFISTFIAVLKTEFDTKNSNAKGPIIGSALKSIFYFALVPIVCILGVTVANIVLQTLDSATSRGASTFSSQIFTAAAYNSNRARDDPEFARQVYDSGLIPGTASIAWDGSGGQAQAQIADLIDTAFRSNLYAVGANKDTSVSVNTVGSLGIGTRDYSFQTFDVKDYALVFEYYNTLTYNYLIGYVAGLTILFLLLQLLIGVIRRVFELAILFVVSPAIVALMPLDGGDKFKTWKNEFIKRVFSAYGPIIGLNLVFMILEVLQTVRLF